MLRYLHGRNLRASSKESPVNELATTLLESADQMMTPDFVMINAKNIIEATPSGEIDLEQSKKVLIELASSSSPLLAMTY